MSQDVDEEDQTDYQEVDIDEGDDEDINEERTKLKHLMKLEYSDDESFESVEEKPISLGKMVMSSFRSSKTNELSSDVKFLSPEDKKLAIVSIIVIGVIVVVAVVLKVTRPKAVTFLPSLSPSPSTSAFPTVLKVTSPTAVTFSPSLSPSTSPLLSTSFSPSISPTTPLLNPGDNVVLEGTSPKPVTFSPSLSPSTSPLLSTSFSPSISQSARTSLLGPIDNLLQRTHTFVTDDANDSNATSVALGGGDYIVIGVTQNNVDGKVIVKKLWNWEEVKSIEMPGIGLLGSFSINNKILAIGVPSESSVRIYEVDNNWKESNITETNLVSFGSSLSLSTNPLRIAIGAPESNAGERIDSGEVIIYEYDGDQWLQIGGALQGSNAGDKSGSALSLSHDGNTLVVGASEFEESAGKIEIHRYRLETKEWTTDSNLTIEGDSQGEKLGSSLSYSKSPTNGDECLALGAPGHDSVSCKIYKISSNELKLQEELLALPEDNEGHPVTLSGNDTKKFAFSSPHADAKKGRVYLYANIEEDYWREVGNLIGDGTEGLGTSINIHGKLLIVGTNSGGKVYVFSISE